MGTLRLCLPSLGVPWALRFSSVNSRSLEGSLTTESPWTEAVFQGQVEGAGAGLLDHHHIILTVLAQVQLGKVKSLHTGSLQLRTHPEEKNIQL
ncbi:hypothetical protein EYF80_058791 [Liparis tanakae]|uniref:Uncharacterized protein n=1 Tax=Liparis tanakae TaxID=230148 RepID=A0A4Z2EQH1_9TELE|nr:hypothetical protein EYF80_058791 [Liparis tanakae]